MIPVEDIKPLFQLKMVFQSQAFKQSKSSIKF